MNELHLADRPHDSALEARIQSLEMAFRMQFEALDAFDIGREPPTMRDRYGKGEFADACLIARRLAERGVRMVQVYYGNGQPWDDHGDIANHRDHAQKSDQPIAALLKDLKARGLLDDTLVIWGGEFGRTPASQGSKGRDHHSLGFTHVAGRRRRQGGPRPRRDRRVRLRRRPRTRCTSTTCTPPSCT